MMIAVNAWHNSSTVRVAVGLGVRVMVGVADGVGDSVGVAVGVCVHVAGKGRRSNGVRVGRGMGV